MAKRRSIRLTSGEMELMSILWEHGPLTLAEAHERLERSVAYTTAQTRLNRLVDKRLATKSADRPAKYQAAVQPEQVSAPHLNDLLERVTHGNVLPLVAHLVSGRSLSREEVDELKRLVDEAEQRLQQDLSRKTERQAFLPGRTLS